MVINKLKKRLSEEPFVKFSQTVAPVSVFYFDLSLEVDNKKITEDILDYKKSNPHSRTSSIEAWHSSFKTHLLTDKFNKLLSIIENKVSKCINHPNLSAKVFESWAITYKKGDSTDLHNHGISAMSSVYYAKVVKNSTPLLFKDGPSITPTENCLIIFPGYVYHSVPEIQEDERIVFTANFTMVPDSYINKMQ